MCHSKRRTILTKTESLHNVYVVPFLLHHQTKRNRYIQTNSLKEWILNSNWYQKVWRGIKTSSKQNLILFTFWRKTQSLSVLFADRQPKTWLHRHENVLFSSHLSSLSKLILILLFARIRLSIFLNSFVPVIESYVMTKSMKE